MKKIISKVLLASFIMTSVFSFTPAIKAEAFVQPSPEAISAIALLLSITEEQALEFVTIILSSIAQTGSSIATSTLSYNENTATGTVPTSVTLNVGATTTVATTSLTKAGHFFYSWNTAANGSGSPSLAGATYTFGPASTTLYAIWALSSQSPATTTITYYPNYRGGVFASSTLEFGTTTIVNAAITRPGYTFKGWNNTSNGSGALYVPGTVITPTFDLSLYAVWQANPAVVSQATTSISYDDNEADSGTVPEKVTLNVYNASGATSTATTSANTGNLVKAGFTFSGWGTLNTTKITDGTSFFFPVNTQFYLTLATTTFFAVWTPDGQTVATSSLSYDLNGGSGTLPASTTLSVGATTTVATSTGLTKVNFTFDSWNTSAAATGTEYLSGEQFTATASSTILYAIWTENEATTTITVDTGSLSGALNTVVNRCAFDAVKYANYYPDVKAMFGTNTAQIRNHWLTVGIDEGRTPCGSDMPSCKFNVLNYILIYPDLVAVSNNPYYKGNTQRIMTDGTRHYKEAGINEGRSICGI